MMELVAQITAGGDRPFTAGLVLHDDDVVEAAPIIAFMVRAKWSRTRVRVHCEDMGWKIKVISERRLHGYG